MKQSASEGCQASDVDLRRENERLILENSRLAHALEEAQRRAAEAEKEFNGPAQHTPNCKRTHDQIPEMDQALERRNAELDAERARWQGVVEGIADEVWMCDVQGRMSLMNLPAMTRMGLEEFQDRTLEEVLEDVEILNPDGQPRPLEDAPLLRSLRGEIVRGEEIMRHRQTGIRRYRQFSSAPIHDATGATTGAVAIMRDITESRLTEDALRESEQRYRTLGEAIPYGVWTTDATGYCTYVSASFLELVGMTLEQVQHLGWLHLLPPEDVQPTKDQWLHCVQTGEDFEREHWFRTKDGGFRTVLAIGRPVRDEQGRITSWAGINLDITERKRAEDALRESGARLRTVLDQMPSGVTIRDASSEEIILFNEQARRILGMPVPTLQDAIRYEGVHPDGRSYRAEEWPLSRALAHGETVQGEEIELRGAEGSRVTISTNAAPIRSPDGQVIAGVAVFHDVTERKQAEAALRESEARLRKLSEELDQRVRERTAELEDANRELEAFSYSVSHDLRAPLRSIDGFSAALTRYYSGKLDAQGEDYLNRVRASAQHMGQLIEDILGLSRATRAEMHRQSVDLSALAGEVLAGLREAQPDRRVETVITAAMVAEGDPHLLRIVLDNLLGNAWKYTGRWPVARIEFGERTQAGEHIFFVRDNGAGFDPAYAEKLFKPFQRLHTEDEFPGTGIGLALVQRIVRRHGGRVWAEGAVNKGATVYFTLPRRMGDP